MDLRNIDVLPNCILKNEKADPKLSANGIEYLYLFCANCGKDGGRVRKADVPRNFAFYQCDDCATKYGQLTNTYVEPDAVFWARMHQEQIEKYGHILDEFELAEALKDENGTLSKLVKDYTRDANVLSL